MPSFLLWFLVSFGATAVIGSFFEWTLHRFVMHNVVFPIADLCPGTLMMRSKCHFAQPTGPAVPNVQPGNAVMA